VFASGPGNPRRARIERWVADAVEREDWVPAVSGNGGARQRSAPLVVAACLHAEHPRAGEVGRYRGGEHQLIGVAQLATAVDQERPWLELATESGLQALQYLEKQLHRVTEIFTQEGVKLALGVCKLARRTYTTCTSGL
jgi:hypothetical protein